MKVKLQLGLTLASGKIVRPVVEVDVDEEIVATCPAKVIG